MKISRLSTILNKISNRKFRKGYIKYITSLDYKEYETLFVYNTEVVNVLSNRYLTKKYKFLSKGWFKSVSLKMKYDLFYNCFITANPQFMLDLNKNLKNRNRRREKILKSLADIREKIEKTYSMEIIIYDPPTFEDKVKLILMVANSISIEKELKMLLNEFNEFNKHNR